MVNIHHFALDSSEFGNIEKLTKAQDLQFRLQNLTERDWSGKSPTVIWDTIKKYISYLPLECSVAAPFDIDQIRLYRCRLNINESSEDLGLWSTYSCPPPSYCKTNGRANVANFPVFYCSDHPTTAISEIRPKQGDVIYHSEWFVRCFRDTRRTIIFPTDISESNPWRNIAANKLASELSGYKGIVGKTLSKNVKTLLAFLAEMYVSEKHPYSMSSAISHKLMFGNSRFSTDYIVYPSFQVNGSASNLAFHPNFVQQNFYLNKILKLEVHQTSETGLQVKHCSTGRTLYNRIEWGEPDQSELDFLDSNIMT